MRQGQPERRLWAGLEQPHQRQVKCHFSLAGSGWCKRSEPRGIDISHKQHLALGTRKGGVEHGAVEQPGARDWDDDTRPLRPLCFVHRHGKPQLDVVQHIEGKRSTQTIVPLYPRQRSVGLVAQSL